MEHGEYASRLAGVRGRIEEAAKRSGRDASEVVLVAVSKWHGAASVRALYEAGQRDFGESYVQEALAKAEELSDLDARWHFIGGLQTNKAKFVAGGFHLVHSLDSIKLARALHNRAEAAGAVQDVLLQVNLAGEEQKRGLAEDEAARLLEAAGDLPGIRPRGLMTMPPFSEDPEASRPLFARLRKLRDGLERKFGLDLLELSMGMSGDFPQAVEEGATLVRVGTDLFGPREY
jgi:pyridoxal phosphate enzyme (YggS family)